MSSIDLIILGIVSEKPQSAYDIQKDIEYHHFSRWTKVSVPSIYKKVLQLKENGYLSSESVKGSKFAQKEVYSITDSGMKYFEALMLEYSQQPVPLLFDFNVVITNLNKLNKAGASALIENLKCSIKKSACTTDSYMSEYPDIPLVGKAVFEQQKILYQSLLQWLESFETQYKEEQQ